MIQSAIGNTTVYPVEDRATQLEFNRLTKTLAVPVGTVVEFYGDHSNPPFGWLSLNSTLRLPISNYQKLYTVMMNGSNIGTVDGTVFYVPAASGKIIKV